MELVDALRLALVPGAPDVVALVGGGGKSSTAFRMAAEAARRGCRAVVTTTTRIGANEVAAAPAVVEVTGPILPLAQLAAALDAHPWCLLLDATQGEKRSGVSPGQVDELAGAAPQLDLALIAVEADGSRQLPVKAPAGHEPVIPACATLVVAVAGVDALGRALTSDQVHRPERMRTLLGLAASGPAWLTPRQMAQLLLHPQGGDQGRPAGARRVLLVNKVEAADQLAAARLVAAHSVAVGVPALLGAVGRAGAAPVRERWGPIGVVVLAAGRSARMGRAKQTLEIEGVPLVRRAVTTALAAGAQQVVLVTGAHAAAVQAALGPVAALTMVHNPLWESGQASSLQAGLAALRPEIEAALFLPVDQPYVPVALLRRLAHAWRMGAGLAAPQVLGEMRGAPALFDRSLWPELLAVRGDVGGRGVLRRHAAAVQTVSAQAAWLADLDTPDDLPASLIG